MSKLFPILIIVVAALAGGGGGFFLKTKTATDVVEPAPADESHEPAADKHEKNSKGGHNAPNADELTYVKFKRQFVVPVIKNGQPKLLMVFDINIEVDNSFGGNAYSLEPRLRDAMLAQLFVFANSGILMQITESTEARTKIKAALLETARKIMGDSALEILLIDIGIQEY